MNTTTADLWRTLTSGRGAAPSWGKLMMWLFIASDALTFAGLVAVYGFLRLVSPEWPVAAEVFDMRLITFMTFALISSSAVMAMAVGAARQGNRRDAARFLGLTIVGGLIFLGCQALEWSYMIGEGATLSANPWGAPQFGAAFFVITGFHGFHVLMGVTLLVYTALRTRRGAGSADRIEIAGLYWHFVDVVWVFIFAFFYLI